MSRTVPNYDPHQPQATRTPHKPTQQPDSTEKPPDTRHWIYLTWRERERPDAPAHDYGRVYPCAGYHDMVSRRRELETARHQPGWPTLAAYDVQIDYPISQTARQATPEGRAELVALVDRVKNRKPAPVPDVF